MQEKNSQDSKVEQSVEAQAVPETSQERFERERLARRHALKRFGITSAMATFALFSVDDLARIVGKSMQQNAKNNKIAEQTAQEFRNSGVASADPANPSGTGSPPNPNCQGCVDAKTAGLNACAQALGYCEDGEVADRKDYPDTKTDPCSISLGLCQQGVACNYAACCKQYSCNC